VPGHNSRLGFSFIPDLQCEMFAAELCVNTYLKDVIPRNLFHSNVSVKTSSEIECMYIILVNNTAY
jgi:hypothetical protein